MGADNTPVERPLVLIVEDETKLAEILSEYLRQAGFRTERLERGDRVVSFVESQVPDLVLLDLMLPGRDGKEVCRDLRRFSKVPIIIPLNSFAKARISPCTAASGKGSARRLARDGCFAITAE